MNLRLFPATRAYLVELRARQPRRFFIYLPIVPAAPLPRCPAAHHSNGGAAAQDAADSRFLGWAFTGHAFF